ncbi:MAG: translocation/assembly module TamB domain-containing protein [Xenococcaceae cyanobacterium]
MTQTPNSDNEEINSSDRLGLESPPKKRWWRRILMGMSVVSVIGIGGSFAYGWYFLENQLSPLVERELTDYLNRPIKIGEFEGITPGKLRLGASEIPATAIDPDRVKTESVEVSFSMGELIFQRHLNLDVLLIKPKIHIEQDKRKTWVSTKIDSSSNAKKQKPFIEVDVKTIQFQDADLELVARSLQKTLNPPVNFKVDSGVATFLKRNKTDVVEFQVNGKSVKGGNIKVNGFGFPKTDDIELTVAGKQLQAVDIANLLSLPLKFQAGTIDGNLKVKLPKKADPLINGTATLNEVNARIAELTQPFSNSNGKLIFKDTEIGFDRLETFFGDVAGTIDGILETSKKKGSYQLSIQTKPTQIDRVINTLKLEKPEIPLIGSVKSAIQIRGALEKPIVDFDVVTIGNSRIDKVDFKNIRAALQLAGNTLDVREFEGFPQVGGRFTGNGAIELKNSNDLFFNVRAINVPGNALARSYNTTLPVNVGLVSGLIPLVGKTDSLSTLRAIDGLANFPLGGGTVTIDKIRYASGSWQANMQTNNVKMTSLPLDKEAATTIGQGFLDGKFKLAGNNNSVSLETIRATGIANVRIASGTVSTNNLQLNRGLWRSDLQATGLKLRQLFPDVPVELSNPISGNFALNGTTENLALDGISGTGLGQIAALGGIITAKNIKIINGKYQATVIPDRLRLKELADINGVMGGILKVTGKLDNFEPTAIAATGSVNFSEGINVLDRPLNALIDWNGKRLVVDKATATGFLADGFFDVDRTFFKDIPDKLVAVKNWRLNVRQARAIDLHKLPLNLPSVVAKTPYSGNVDFIGILSGTLKEPVIRGDLVLNNFAVQDIRFEPMLRGTVEIVPSKGTDLDLKGNEDRLQLELAADNQPRSFLIKKEETVFSGTRAGNLLRVDTNSLPIAWLKNFAVSNFEVPETIAAQTISGDLSSNFTFDLKTKKVDGTNLIINRPVFGRIKGNLFTGNFQYNDGYFSLQNGTLQQGNSEYQVNGELWQTKIGPKFNGRAKIVQGQVQDVLEALQIFQLSDFGQAFGDRKYNTAADLYTKNLSICSPPYCPLFATGIRETSIANQLRRISEVSALLRMERKKRQNASFLPELSDLNGNFDGTITVEGSTAKGVTADFQFEGKDWQWGALTADRFLAAGNFQNGILTLLPISVKTDRSLVTFSGSFGGETQSGQLRFVDLPVESLQKLVKLPPEIGLGGRINGTATLSGSQETPQAKGEIVVDDARINQTSIQSTQGSFSYNNSRFEFFASSVVAENAEPLTITGSLPYKFTASAIEPDSNELNLNLNIKNEGFKLLNILSKGEVRWLSGQGDVTLDISGIFDPQRNLPTNLRAQGIATIADATIEARTLPKAPLTQVNGNILFDLDRMQVETLQGNFGGGQISVAGDLSLGKPNQPENPLTVNLNNLAIDLKGLYQGGVKGQLQVTGSAFQPDISGDLNLFDGTILLGDTNEVNKVDQTNNTNIDGITDEGLAAATEFNRLKIELDRNIQIIKPPILNFIAEGSLNVSGTFNRPLPEGKIKLKRGQVNIFTTQLNLDRNAENTARFNKQQGLDPYLDVSLAGSAVETSRSSLAVDPSLTEINDIPLSNFGTLQTIRISANVKGLASQLTNNIDLSSSPPRSQTEIISLLGGSFVTTLGRGDSTLGLANLAGSALFGTFNTAISDAFGLSEFRLFPTQLIDDSKERETIVGLAAEASIDLTKKFSVSVLKILNTEIPAQYGLRYRLDDNFLLRGSSNFDNDSRAIIEYEQRF